MNESDIGKKTEPTTVYKDERFVLGIEGGAVRLKAGDNKYVLSCHPFEPCLYITTENGVKTYVRNAFDPDVVANIFDKGGTVTSITGRVYGPRDFCVMVEYAATLGGADIDDAEAVFGDGGR